MGFETPVEVERWVNDCFRIQRKAAYELFVNVSPSLRNEKSFDAYTDATNELLAYYSYWIKYKTRFEVIEDLLKEPELQDHKAILMKHQPPIVAKVAKGREVWPEFPKAVQHLEEIQKVLKEVDDDLREECQRNYKQGFEMLKARNAKKNGPYASMEVVSKHKEEAANGIQ
ncbi:MAG: hypothetical protein RDV48_04565 [Candidatus Eremiobacteraeota bacterium]|nr:hypothetical protein [Candidatus Eremiobacteraeota bacterium]